LPEELMQMATRTTLNVSLPVELGHFIAAKIASGRYASASEVVRAGLRLLEASEALSFVDSAAGATRTAHGSAHDPTDVGTARDA
jgi:antitoxin ParD1/3/4